MDGPQLNRYNCDPVTYPKLLCKKLMFVVSISSLSYLFILGFAYIFFIYTWICLHRFYAIIYIIIYQLFNYFRISNLFCYSKDFIDSSYLRLTKFICFSLCFRFTSRNKNYSLFIWGHSIFFSFI